MIDARLQRETFDSVILQLRVSSGGEWIEEPRLRPYLRSGWRVADAHEVSPQDGFIYLTVHLVRGGMSGLEL